MTLTAGNLPRSLVTALALGLSLFVPQPGVRAGEASSAWHLTFEDSFDRNDLGPDWVVRDGRFKPVYDAPNGIGRLHGRGEALLLRKFPGDVRVEMQASAKQPGDLSITLATNEQGFADGYFLGFGSNDNSLSKMLRLGKKAAISDARIVPGKRHKIVAEKSGRRVTLTVDGKEVLRFDDPQPLGGPDHQMIGIYIFKLASVDYVKVYGRKGQRPIKLSKLPVTKVKNVAAADAPKTKSPINLVGNPSFEAVLPGIWPRLPQGWVPEYSAVGDRPQLIRDAEAANRGERFVRLKPKGPWMKIHSLGTKGSGVALEGGKTYRFAALARKCGSGRASIEFHPSDKKFSLTRRWRKYTTTWKAPGKLPKSARGFYLKVSGDVDIDDVLVFERGKAPAVSPVLRTDRAKMKATEVVPGWLSGGNLPRFQERIHLELSEVLGEPATGVPVGVPVAELFGTLPAYEFVSPEKVRIVDGSTGRTIRFAIKEVDLVPTITAGDHVVFAADVPALSRKRYFVYLTDRLPTEKRVLGVSETKLPHDLRSYAGQSGRLLAEVTKIERIGTLVIRRDRAGRILCDLTAPSGSRISGTVSAPDGQTFPISLRNVADTARWEGRFVLPTETANGIWSVSVDLVEPSGAKQAVTAAFVVGAGIWAGGNLKAIRSDDPPSPGRSTANLIAARGERESFQVVIAADKSLKDVRLRASDLKQVDGSGRIPAGSWTLERVEELFVGMTAPSRVLRVVDGEFINAGNYPDPLLPWRSVDIEPGRQRVCLATVRVPHGIPAGKYSGAITAEAQDGTKLELPVNLRVYDFDMPKRSSFKILMSAAIGYVSVPKDRKGRFGRDVRYYHLWDREAAEELALFVAERGMIPAQTGQPFGAHATPWTYDRGTRTAKIDFTQFDRSAEPLLDRMGVEFIAIAKSSGWRRAGKMFTYPSVDNWPKKDVGWGTGYKNFPQKALLDTEEGLAMLEAYARALAEHLEKKNWLDRVSIYIYDEPKSKHVHDTVLRVAQTIRRAHPKLKMWGAGYGTAWRPYFDYIDMHTGTVSKQVRQKMKEKGMLYFGKYNQPIDILAVPRVVPLHGWSEGWDGYYHHETTTNGDSWLNPEPPRWANRYVPKYAASFPSHWMMLSGFIYHWPVDELAEPLPAGKKRAWASSLRLEAFREAAEDVEYFITLRKLAEESPAGSETKKRFKELSERLKTYLETGRTPYSHNWYYNYRLDEGELIDIRRQVCEAIEKAS